MIHPFPSFLPFHSSSSRELLLLLLRLDDERLLSVDLFSGGGT